MSFCSTSSPSHVTSASRNRFQSLVTARVRRGRCIFFMGGWGGSLLLPFIFMRAVPSLACSLLPCLLVFSFDKGVRQRLRAAPLSLQTRFSVVFARSWPCSASLGISVPGTDAQDYDSYPQIVMTILLLYLTVCLSLGL